MSTQLKTRPTESPTRERPAIPQEVGVPDLGKAPVARRTSGWVVLIAAVAVVALSLVAMAALTNDTTSSAPDYVPAYDSPGGNSLLVPATGTDAYLPAHDSPGGNSLLVPATGTDAYLPAHDSPGGNSLDIPTFAFGVDVLAFEGPGGNSLAIP